MKPRKIFFFLGVLIFTGVGIWADEFSASENDKCGYPLWGGFAKLAAEQGPVIPGWGYTYDSLKNDLALWKSSPNIKIDSIGASGQNRAIYKLTITSTLPVAKRTTAGATGDNSNKPLIFMHVRTHPAEVQTTWVIKEAIKFLLDTTQVSDSLRKHFVFQIIPMYNPDGVELGLPRENAAGIDLESNWSNANPQPEVLVLKQQFETLMASTTPVKVALNLHSDKYNESRFFFFHHAKGTSEHYTQLETKFIKQVQNYFPTGIKEPSFQISWKDSTEIKYPEGYWWTNYRENVLALTYEDNNSLSAGKYDSTARALILGATDYLLYPLRISSFKTHSEMWSQKGTRFIYQGLDVQNKFQNWFFYNMQGQLLAKGEISLAGEIDLSFIQTEGQMGVLQIFSKSRSVPAIFKVHP